MMINENPDFDTENEGSENSDSGNPSFTGGLGQAVGREIRREISHEVVGGVFGFIRDLFTDDEDD